MKNTIKLLLTAVLSVALIAPMTASAKVPAEKKQELEKRKKARGGKALGPRVGKRVQKAFELYSEDKINEALEILLEIKAKSDFDKAYVYRFIGSMYAGMEGKADDALDVLYKAMELDQLPFDDHAGVIKLIADLSLQEKKYQEAIVHYHKYLEFSWDEDASVYLRIANAYIELKEYDKVIKPAKEAIARYEKPNQNPYILIMASYYERKMYKETTKAVEDLVKNFPTEAKWWPQLGMFYMLLEDYQRGLSIMELAHKQGFLEKEAQFKQLAQLYASNGIPVKAAEIQEKYMNEGIIKKDENSVNIMATTFQNAKEFKKAAKYFGEAAAIKGNADIYRKQANVYLVLEDFKSAAKAFENAIDAGAKKKGQVYMGMAEAYFYMEDWKKAYAAILEAKKDKATKKSAVSWQAYIKDTAERKGVFL